MSAEEIERKIAVIFATDVVSYSKHVEIDESNTLKNLRSCEKILMKLFAKHKGRLFNTGGDSFLAEFPSAVSAVECAVEFQQSIAKRNSLADTSVKLEFRIGINSGDVVIEKGNLMGDGVNIAARLEALAQTSGISISKVIYDFVKGKTKYEFHDLGIQKIKQNEFHAFDILLGPKHRRKIKSSNRLRFSMAGGVSVFLIIGLASFFFFSKQTEDEAEIALSSKPLVFISRVEGANFKSEEKQFLEGLTEAITSQLSKSGSIRIVPRKTATRLEELKIENEKLASLNGVKFLVSPSMQIFGSVARINIEISDLEKKQVVVSAIKDFELTNKFSFQDQVGEHILSEFLVNVLNQKGLYESYFSWRKTPITPRQLVQYANFRSEMAKWTEEGFVNASRILVEMKRWPGPNKQKDWLVQDTWLDFFGMAMNKLPKTPENLDKLRKELDLTISIKPSPENYASRALLSLSMGITGCEQAFNDLRLAHQKAGNADSYGYASVVYGRCGKTHEAATHARNQFDMTPIDTNWRSTTRLAFRLYENQQKKEMYILLEDVLDAIDLPAPLLAFIAYDKYKVGEEKLAKTFFVRAKKSGFTNKALDQLLYLKSLREDVSVVLERLNSEL